MENRQIPKQVGQDDLAEYIEQIAGQLAVRTRAAKLPFLTYLIEMVALEAQRLRNCG